MVNLPWKRFRVTVANADIGSLKYTYFLLNMFVPRASEIWTKSYDPNHTKFLSVLTKSQVFKNHFW